jgi:short-subunit dehydrogenase
MNTPSSVVDWVLITGGTKGIGLATARIFAQNGYGIITCSRHQEDLLNFKENFIRNYQVPVQTYQGDLAEPSFVEKICRSCIERDQIPAVLINNAALYWPGTILSETPGNLELMLAVNLYAPYELCRKLIPQMLIRGKGDIFNIGSISSIRSLPEGGIYSISKHALSGMTKTLRAETMHTPIRVSLIIPGATFTSSWDGVPIDPNRLMPPEDVASAIFYAHQLTSRSILEEIIIRPIKGDL